VKKKIKKKFLRHTEKIKCLMSVDKKLVLEKKERVGDESYRKIYQRIQDG